MKKLICLTSILALTACATGGNGGTGTPEQPRIALVSQEAIDSNKELTDMASQILIATDGVSPSIVRSATVTHNGKEYKSYDLSDVEFKTAAFADDFTKTNPMATLKFNVENGKITGVLIDEPEHWGEKGIVLTRDDNTNMLSGGGTFDGQIVATISDATYKSVAKSADNGDNLTRDSLGLKYSDFGILHLAGTLQDVGEIDSKLLFAGGYDTAKKLDVSEQQQQKTFNGRAIGQVSRGEDGANGTIMVYTNNATLTFNPAQGQSVAYANIEIPFYVLNESGEQTTDKWYTVNAEINSTFTNDPNTNIQSLTFTDEGIDTNKYANYKFDSENSYDAKPNTLASQDSPVIRDGFVEFYGDDGKPSEAVGTLKYMEERDDYEGGRIGFEAAIGVRVKAQ